MPGAALGADGTSVPRDVWWERVLGQAAFARQAGSSLFVLALLAGMFASITAIALMLRNDHTHHKACYAP